MTKRSSRPAAGPVTKALARVERRLKLMAGPAPGESFMPGAPAALTTVTPMALEQVQLGGAGLVELKLTDAEEMVLAKPVDLGEMRMKPTGQPYLSHPTYTRWFNQAFGRLGWMLLPADAPATTPRGVIMPFYLLIHGHAVAKAWGEQDYFETNRDQSYGDALEACFASALRRLAKRLGVGLELWDKPWLEQYVREHCIKVKCSSEKRGVSYVWRRKIDPPFWNETGVASHDDHEPDVEPAQRHSAPAPATSSSSSERPAGHNPQAGLPISEKQVKRYHAIVGHSHRGEQIVKEWLERVWGYTSSKDIERRDYDRICSAIEGPGQLSEKRS